MRDEKLAGFVDAEVSADILGARVVGTEVVGTEVVIAELAWVVGPMFAPRVALYAAATDRETQSASSRV